MKYTDNENLTMEMAFIKPEKDAGGEKRKGRFAHKECICRNYMSHALFIAFTEEQANENELLSRRDKLFS